MTIGKPLGWCNSSWQHGGIDRSELLQPFLWPGRRQGTVLPCIHAPAFLQAIVHYKASRDLHELAIPAAARDLTAAGAGLGLALLTLPVRSAARVDMRCWKTALSGCCIYSSINADWKAPNETPVFFDRRRIVMLGIAALGYSCAPSPTTAARARAISED